ncbi:hypothetical protein M9H77_28272 [Catharanthus roseus]|uniref:Uncharacterized protein n=1 Tax=Catharanthus roseus TaxID=4058 RepID=A0ACC0AFT7_CATRO|nr:hypothetical protein M9H77_28272 [Catharanthus roseus]
MLKKSCSIFLPLMLLLLLLVSMVALSDAVPTSRSQMMFKDDQPEALHDSHVQDAVENGDDYNGQLQDIEGHVERRMEIETTDYPGTGANNHHDPTTPGGF